MLLANVESILNKFGVEPQLNLFLAKKTVCIVENWEVDAGGGGHGGGEGGGERGVGRCHITKVMAVFLADEG